MSFFNARVFIGTLLFLAFIVMLVTSVLLYSQQHDAVIALIHTLIGAAMILVVVWHLFKNSKPLFAYLNPLKKHMGKISFAIRWSGFYGGTTRRHLIGRPVVWIVTDFGIRV